MKIVMRLAVLSADALIVQTAADAVGVEPDAPRGKGSRVQLAMAEAEAHSAAVLDTAVEEFARIAIDILGRLDRAVFGDASRTEVSIALFPEDSMNAGFFLPRTLMEVAARLNVDVYFSAY